MSLSFGGLSLLTSWNPFYLWDDSVHTRSEFRSFVCALVFVAVILILAYLTNPTEVSFRAYLTEQSFRQHLSHLDDVADDSSTNVNSRLSPAQNHHLSLDRATLPFHFSSRASVSLRTPKHVFHTFGICTIATTRGAATASGVRRTSTANGHVHSGHGADHDGSLSSDSWFVGAFGHWWRGGHVEAWYYDAVARSKDAEGWSSGILGFKSLDRLNDQNGLPFAKPVSCPLPSSRGTPPKLRNRERSLQRSGLSRRNSTPPPLPKSASLPLHTDHRIHEHVLSSSQASPLAPDYKRIAVHAPQVAHTISRATSTSGVSDHSPLIAEVLKQIDGAQVSVNELKTQLEETRAAATQSHSLLEVELDVLRSRKREEDQKRADGRTRTKTLEEARRLAEAGKREAEKKLKAARGTKESAKLRVQELEDEVERLKQRMEHDRVALAAEPGVMEVEEERELVCELESKRKEVRVAEDVVAALNARARELEERILASKERLRSMEEQAEVAQSFCTGADPASAIYAKSGCDAHAYDSQVETASWPYNSFDIAADVLSSSADSKNPRSSTGSDSRNGPYSSKPSRLSLGVLSNFSPKAYDPAIPRTRGYAVFDDDLASLAHRSPQPLPHSAQSYNGYLPHGQSSFSPFSDVQNPSSAYIPSSLISVLDSPSAEWKSSLVAGAGGFASSPVSFTGSSVSEMDSELDPFEVRHHSQPHGPPVCGELGLSYRTNSDPSSHGSDNSQVNATAQASESTSRRWFSSPSRERQHKGLNPDAKVFRLPRRKLPTTSARMSTDASSHSFDALNPTGLMSSITSSTPSSLLRAFAPSRAEREALQRALSGSTNTSLERLPSLSDVGSIPSSPVPGHAETQQSIGEKERGLPAWLQSLPLIRKPNFSPWEDEELVSAEVKVSD
ncbi:hypothetical protein F5I97DRAFT_740887 [Phlebopus sp. FC_14]|nr:hypothetical protein F5I97DRAFT_740887 [Phlebopus sp. FC_14]